MQFVGSKDISTLRACGMKRTCLTLPIGIIMYPNHAEPVRRFQAVLFDCDGVLVDSESLIVSLLVTMTNELGGRLNLAEGEVLFHGVHLAGCIERIEQHVGRPAPADFSPQYRQRSAALMAEQLTSVAGVQRLIDSLAVPTCVVSNSSPERVEFMLARSGLLGYFRGRIYSADDLGRWKPAPDVYLHAAAQLGFRPAECIAIEDSEVGVRSAVAAGLTVLGFASPPRAPALLAAGATTTCQTMTQVGDLLRALTVRTDDDSRNLQRSRRDPHAQPARSHQ
jgi:HAD superfamily hydrolase (TIGR01509 family)